MRFLPTDATLTPPHSISVIQVPANSTFSVSLSDIEVSLPGIWVPGDALGTGDVFTMLQTLGTEPDLSKRLHTTPSGALVSYLSNTIASGRRAPHSSNLLLFILSAWSDQVMLG